MCSRQPAMRAVAPIVFVALGSLLSSPAEARAQPATPRPAAVRDGTAELARGWTALSTGRATDAERASDAVLKTSPRNHDALALKIRARLLGRNVGSALDAYEAWLPQVREREDVFLLESIALGVAESLVSAADPTVKARALELLAASGDDRARAELATLSTAQAGAKSSTFRTDRALARLGDADAVRRIAAQIKAGAGRDVSEQIDALRDGGVKTASGTIAAALDPARPLPTKIAAARALGELGDSSAIPTLRNALKDPDPPVRVMAAAALARLGDDAGIDIVRKFENSPVGDLRLLAVEASAAGNPTGPWVGVASGVLKDPDPLVRLQAAELLLQHAAEPGNAREVLFSALGDANPAMRTAAVRSLERIPAAAMEQDLKVLRKLLRDPSPVVQLEAAAGLLRVSGVM
jgi:HEAT repeat protein